MAKFNIEDLTGPFLKAFQGEIGLEKATEIAAYNMMMTYIQDWMAKAALKSVGAKFLFTGFIGSIFNFGLGFLVSFIAKEGKNFAADQVHKWHIKSLEKAYLANMAVYNKEIDIKEVITEQDKANYKQGIKSELKKFFNLSRFFKSKP